MSKGVFGRSCMSMNIIDQVFTILKKLMVGSKVPLP